MATYQAPGLTGDWLNGWLAAVGVTVLLPGTRLAWTADVVPKAVFHSDDGADIPSRLAGAIPQKDWLDSLVISGLPRNVTLESYRDRCAASRSSSDTFLARDFSLALSVTDLVDDVTKEVRHSDFDPPAPKGSTMESRLRLLLTKLGEEQNERWRTLTESLEGRGPRCPANGLGFDIRRLPSGVHSKGSPYVDPAVECLTFFALGLFNVRGDGVRSLPRGWTPGRGKARRFCWPTWSQPLDAWAIDALLDRSGEGASREALSQLGVTARFVTVPYRPLGTSDVTRGFSAQRLA